MRAPWCTRAAFRDAAAASPKSPLHAELLLEQAAALTAMGNHQEIGVSCLKPLCGALVALHLRSVEEVSETVSYD